MLADDGNSTSVRPPSRRKVLPGDASSVKTMVGATPASLKAAVYCYIVERAEGSPLLSDKTSF